MSDQVHEAAIYRSNPASKFFDLSAEAEDGLPCEIAWRRPPEWAGSWESRLEVWRWTDSRTVERREVSDTPADCHIISVALKAARLTLTASSTILFEGLMPSGMVHISRPSERIVAQLHTPCDFLNVYVGNGVLDESTLVSKDAEQAGFIGRRLYRDRVVELLSQSLIDAENPCHRGYAESIGKTIAMRAMRRRPPEKCVAGLPKWRLEKLKQYIQRNITNSISLQDMAVAIGLSRMHFAAQFRIATGFRPHEYLLLQRVERAKFIMIESEMPLVEVALSVGFQAQTHFSTVFKRFSGMSPARWRREHQFDCVHIED